MLNLFASEYKLSIRPEYESTLQKTLDSCFSIEGEGLVRSFGQISSVFDGGSVWLFRAVELLDLNPHAQSYSTHFTRVAALFKISKDHDEFFLLDKSMTVSRRLPKSKPPNVKVIEITKKIAVSCKAKHSLSVTLTRGNGLIYFEPTVTGGETLSDVSSLYCIAKKMAAKLSENV
jgi:hypothetical protein